MSKTPQRYENHAHTPWLAGLAYLGAGLALVGLLAQWLFGWSLAQAVLACLVVASLALASASRVYITALQDRIIRLEMQVRLRMVLPPERHADIPRLSVPQLVGLRFASDRELPALVDRALREGLTRDQIKRAVTDWQADDLRT